MTDTKLPITCTRSMTVLDQLDPWLPVYAQADEEGSLRTHLVELDRQVWKDMGMPTSITITIEPGDKLNEEEASA